MIGFDLGQQHVGRWAFYSCIEVVKIKAFWREETPPQQWNDGIMTSVWKGKGDRECLVNHRGITVSSAIGTIAEEIVFNRV